MASSPKEIPHMELTYAEAVQLVNFIEKHTKADDPDYLLVCSIEKQIKDSQPNWEESQSLKKVYQEVL
ncbi:hypothetical protein DSO57_1021977 [Entomophthora muscae]|uniref:Uncharacterized protein n=1 Tax=Entomophthora muscae TaxID=34485 RepID=A0ACC2SG98_9FUNG|nr:hypothetical protein DSO57_1021977 [Entomophthora muscae]